MSWGLDLSLSLTRGNGGGMPWYPHRLFQSGDILLWYDPSDLTTMFTDTAGTTQVAADGDSVALMLDKGQWGGKSLTQVLAAQTELAPNTVFDDTTSVTRTVGNATMASTGGRLRLTATDTNASRWSMPVTCVVGRTYRYSVGVFAAGGIASNISVSASNTLVSAVAFTSAAASDRVDTVYFTATATTMYVGGATNAPSVSQIAEWDNATVKEIPGYHRVQATGTSMPKYKTDGTLHWLLYDGTDDGHVTGTIPFNTVTSDGAARRNLFVDTDKLNHTTWTNGVSSNGTRTNGSLSVSDAEGYVYIIQQVTLTAAAHTVSFEAVCDQTVAAVPLRATFGAATATTLVDFVAGVPQRVSMSLTAAAGTNNFNIGLDARNAVVPGGSNSTGYILTLNKAQLELGSTATDFQNIGTDEVAICAGMTKSADQTGIIAELSAIINSNNGAFHIANATDTFQAVSKGTTLQSATFTKAAPTTDVITALLDIPGDSVKLRLNGVQVAESALDQGTGNFGSHVLYFGRRGGSSLPFNGGEYQTVIRSRLLSAAELASLETFVAEKTGVIL